MEQALDVLFTIAELAAIAATLLPLSRSDVWWIRTLDFPRIQIAIVGAVRCRNRIEGGLPLRQVDAPIPVRAGFVLHIMPPSMSVSPSPPPRPRSYMR